MWRKNKNHSFSAAHFYQQFFDLDSTHIYKYDVLDKYSVL
jgi:hypothetical protein